MADCRCISIQLTILFSVNTLIHILLIAIGHALIMNPDWVEKVANGRKAEVASALNVSKLDQLHIPEKLWNVIQASPGWFKIP